MFCANWFILGLESYGNNLNEVIPKRDSGTQAEEQCAVTAVSRFADHASGIYLCFPEAVTHWKQKKKNTSYSPLNGRLPWLLQRRAYFSRGNGFECTRGKSRCNQWGSKITDRSAQIISLFQKFADNVNNKYGVYDEAQDDIRTSILTIGNIRDQWVHPAHTPITLSWHLVRISEDNQNPGFIIANPNYIEVRYQGNLFKLRTLYDIVGWIFSVVGHVPSGATRENYYYPLMMIAYHFCRKLVPNKELLLPNGRPITRGVADVWSVIWFNQINNNNQLVTRVVLGASLDNPTLNVKRDTKNFRKERLKDANIFQEGITAPLQAAAPPGQDFGHCAETYPLLFICS